MSMVSLQYSIIVILYAVVDCQWDNTSINTTHAFITVHTNLNFKLIISGIISSPISINAAVGGTTTLTCVIAGYVTSVAWSFKLENEPTTFNAVGTTAPWISTESTDSTTLRTTSKLVISNHVQLTDEGYYKVTATFTNAATATSATAHVPVIGM